MLNSSLGGQGCFWIYSAVSFAGHHHHHIHPGCKNYFPFHDRLHFHCERRPWDKREDRSRNLDAFPKGVFVISVLSFHFAPLPKELWLNCPEIFSRRQTAVLRRKALQHLSWNVQTPKSSKNEQPSWDVTPKLRVTNEIKMFYKCQQVVFQNVQPTSNFKNHEWSSKMSTVVTYRVSFPLLHQYHLCYYYYYYYPDVSKLQLSTIIIWAWLLSRHV